MRTALNNTLILLLLSGLLCPLVSFGQDSLNVRKVAELPVMDEARDIVIQDTLVFVASYRTGLRILSIAHPDTIIEIGSCYIVGGAFEVKLQGDYAYIAAGEGGLRVIDVSDPRNPQEAGFYRFSFNDYEEDDPTYYDVELRDTIAYCCGWYHGVHVISIADPGNPELLSIVLPYEFATDVEIRDTLLFVSRPRYLGLEIFDATNPVSPEHIGWYSTPQAYHGGWSVVRDTIAFVSIEDNIHIVNVANPASPQFVSFLSDQRAESWRISLQDGVAYTSSTRGIDVWDVSDVANPVWFRNWSVPSSRCCFEIAFLGDTAVLAAGYQSGHQSRRCAYAPSTLTGHLV